MVLYPTDHMPVSTEREVWMKDRLFHGNAVAKGLFSANGWFVGELENPGALGDGYWAHYDTKSTEHLFSRIVEYIRTPDKTKGTDPNV